jgi:type I restriction enzyme S subunit
VDAYKTYIDTNLNEQQKSVIDKLIRLFKTARTIQCGIAATLYGAWNDFIIDGKNPTDDQIVNEVLTNWHKSKERIERCRWLAALGWMRQKDIVPVGYGVSTKNGKKEEGV